MARTLAFNQGSRSEIAEDVRPIVSRGAPADRIDSHSVAAYRERPDMPHPDVVIRAAVEQRGSDVRHRRRVRGAGATGTRSRVKVLAVLARAITEASSPTLLVGLLLPLIGYASGESRGFWLGVLASISSAVVPFVFVLRRTRSGRLSDHHVRNRADRAVPLLVSLLSVVLGFVLLVVLHTPRQLLAVMIAGITGIVITIAVTHWWKISIHLGAASGCTTVLAMTFGSAVLMALPLLVVIGWSRVMLQEHTIGQVVAGTAAGALTTGVVLTVLHAYP